MEFSLSRLQKAWGQRAAAATFLLEHPRVTDIQQEGGSYMWCDRSRHGPDGTPGLWVKMSGLTRFLKDFYWPAYTPWKKSESPEIRALRRASLRISGLQKKARHARESAGIVEEDEEVVLSPQEKAKASHRGSIIHRQLHQYVMMDEAHFLKFNPSGLHRGTRAFLKSLTKRGLYPFNVEYKVACTEPDVLLATGIDVMALDEVTGRLAIIEVKTTEGGAAAAAFTRDEPAIPWTGRMRELAKEWHARYPKKPRLARSALNRARVQLAAGFYMAKHGLYPGLDRFEYDLYVVQVAADGGQVHWWPVSETFLTEVGEPLYEDLKLRIADWREEKKKQASHPNPGYGSEDEERPRKRQKRDSF